jgi:type VI secretion system secreted protein Hcp
MAMDMFLEIEGVEGESVDSVKAGAIDILAWSWGASQSGSFHTGTGGGAGKVNVQDLSVTKWIDKSSTDLLLHVCNGEHYDKATLTCRKAGGEALEYLVIEMTKVMITSLSTGGSGGEDRLTENVTLHFAEFSISYKTQAEGGGEEGSFDTGWDIAKNTPLGA